MYWLGRYLDPVTLTYISCPSDFYTFYVNIPLSLGCIIRKVSAEDIATRGNGTGLEYMCPTGHFVYIFFQPFFQLSTAKNEINLLNNHVLIVAPVTFAPAGAPTPSAEFLYCENGLQGRPIFMLSKGGAFGLRLFIRPSVQPSVHPSQQFCNHIILHSVKIHYKPLG